MLKPGMQPNAQDINKIMQKVIPSLMGSILGGGMNTIFGGGNTGFGGPRRSNEKAFNEAAPKVDEVVEPDDSVSISNGVVTHVLHLPGVRSRDDVTVRKLGGSIEIRALAGKKMYLKIINREGGESVMSEDFNDGDLVITLNKK